jgi:peptidoglycan-N-acetylglucosamine deacetylase
LAKITLTFDNGPEPEVTPHVLDCLARYGVKATFFVLGEKVSSSAGKAVSQRARREGHRIGNHTFTHTRPLGQVSPEIALREFERTEQALAWLDQPMRLFRPPGGGEIGPHLLQRALVEKLQSGGYTCVLWNSVPGDFRDPHGWLKRALADCHSQAWTLMALHDLPNGAMTHLDEFLRRLTDDDYEFVQDYPAGCVPILNGKIVLPLDPYIEG